VEQSENFSDLSLTRASYARIPGQRRDFPVIAAALQHSFKRRDGMPDPDLVAEVQALGGVILVLQGGGALGAYQIGVYQALSEAGIQPDWVIGTSIGAINGSIIGGNGPEDRMAKLATFWDRIEQFDPFRLGYPDAAAFGRNMSTLAFGLQGFFRPNPVAMLNPMAQLGPNDAGFYSTEPLRHTLDDLMDYGWVNEHKTRLTVGAASVTDSEMTYFDSALEPLGLDHTMASGALPPAFPPVRVGNKLYWDGGMLSNTPIEYVLDLKERKDALVISVQLWHPHGSEPNSVWEALNRQKDLQFSSRAETHIKRQRELHRLRHVISELKKKVPQDASLLDSIKDLTDYGCPTRLHVVRLLAPALPGETQFKDIDFSPNGIRTRRDAGYQDTQAMLKQAPWKDPFNVHDGLVLHDCHKGMIHTPL